MTEPQHLVSLFSLPFASLREKLVSLGAKPFLATQVFDWIYRKFVWNIADWSNVSKANKQLILANFSLDLPRILWQGHSQDGTRKFLLKFSDDQTIEAVIIPGKNRLTLCLSSQVGCAMGCTFCHTATQGLKRHLKTEEMVGQYLVACHWLKVHVSPDAKISNIVYMGQGEPLHNFNNMKLATEIFLDKDGLGLGQRKITLSTSGLAPQIEKLSDFPPINLAISLHSPRDEIRSKLMPINNTYNLERLFAAISKVPLKAHRRITYEYLLIQDLTDTPEDVLLLSKLLIRKESKINLIPFNEFPDSQFKRPSDQKVQWFQDQMIKAGFTCTVRVTKGEDILAACGQLKSEFDKLNLWNDEKTQIKQLQKLVSKYSFKAEYDEDIEEDADDQIDENIDDTSDEGLIEVVDSSYEKK